MKLALQKCVSITEPLALWAVLDFYKLIILLHGFKVLLSQPIVPIHVETVDEELMPSLSHWKIHQTIVYIVSHYTLGLHS